MDEGNRWIPVNSLSLIKKNKSWPSLLKEKEESSHPQDTHPEEWKQSKHLIKSYLGRYRGKVHKKARGSNSIGSCTAGESLRKYHNNVPTCFFVLPHPHHFVMPDTTRVRGIRHGKYESEINIIFRRVITHEKLIVCLKSNSNTFIFRL